MSYDTVIHSRFDIVDASSSSSIEYTVTSAEGQICPWEWAGGDKINGVEENFIWESSNACLALSLASSIPYHSNISQQRKGRKKTAIIIRHHNNQSVGTTSWQSSSFVGKMMMAVNVSIIWRAPNEHKKEDKMKENLFGHFLSALGNLWQCLISFCILYVLCCCCCCITFPLHPLSLLNLTRFPYFLEQLSRLRSNVV